MRIKDYNIKDYDVACGRCKHEKCSVYDEPCSECIHTGNQNDLWENKTELWERKQQLEKEGKCEK